MNTFPDFTPATLRVGARTTHRRPAALGGIRLPVVLRLLLENVVRHQRGASAPRWRRCSTGCATAPAEIAFQPGRVLMHDTTSTPALVDIAAMRDALAEAGADPACSTPRCRWTCRSTTRWRWRSMPAGRGPRQHRPRDPPQRRALPLPALGRRRARRAHPSARHRHHAYVKPGTTGRAGARAGPGRRTLGRARHDDRHRQPRP